MTPSTSDGEYVLFQRHTLHYTGYFQASFRSTHLFHYGFSTVSSTQCVMLSQFHFSGLMYTCTNYCNILLQGHSYPVWLLPWSATISQGNQGSWPWNWKQTHNPVSDITQTFTLGEALTDMRKNQFLQSLNSKYILLICTILVIFDPLDHLASVRKLPRQLKAEPSCSAHHHVPANWDMAFTCPAALLLCPSCVKGHLHQAVLVLIFRHLIHKNPFENKGTWWWWRKAVERSSFCLIHFCAEASGVFKYWV